MQVIAHYCVCIDANRKDRNQLPFPTLDYLLALLVINVCERIDTAHPCSPHAARHVMARMIAGGERGWVSEMFAFLCQNFATERCLS